MNKRFLYGKIVAAQLAAFALTIFISSNFLFNESTVTNANAAVIAEQPTNNSQPPTPVVDRVLAVQITTSPTTLPSSTPTLGPTRGSAPTVNPPSSDVSPTSQQPSNPPAGENNVSSLESQTISLINDERERQGLRELGVDGSLTTAARRHAQDMCDNNNFSHTGTDGSDFTARAKAAGYGGFASGEVIGWNHASVESIFNGWMGSPSHKEILMKSDVTKIGVGWSGSCVVGVVGS